MKAGVSQVCITPARMVDLTGFWSRVQPATGVHDDLYARGLYLEDAGEKLLWLHCDLLGLDTDFVRRLRQRIARELGLRERQICVSATHTHSGPATQCLRGCGNVDPQYMDELAGRLIDAARRAVAAPENVTLWFAEGCCRLSIDRRWKWYNFTQHAHVDHVLPVLALRRQDGGYLAVLTNYAMHNVAAGGGNRLVSADAAGAAAEMVRGQLPGRPVVLVTNGGAGNVNPPEFGNDFAAVGRVGAKLAAAVMDTLGHLQQCEHPAIASRMQPLRLPLIIPDREDVIWHCMEMGKLSHQREFDEWCHSTLNLLEQGNVPGDIEIDLQAVRIGPASFVAIPAEVFARMAADLRAACGQHTYVAGYANGNIGYLPFREIFDEGGYEVDTAYIVYGNFMRKPEAFDLVRDAGAGMLRGM